MKCIIITGDLRTGAGAALGEHAAVAGASGYYTDPLGAADWRRGVSVELARRVRAQLEEAA